MKKLVCLLSFILIFSCLIACNGSNNTPTVDVVTVNLDLDGGSINGKTSYDAVLWEDVSIPKPTKKGYEFSGWTHNGNFVSLTPWMIEGDSVTIKANWKVRSYEVYFDFNGGVYYEDGVEIVKKTKTITFGDKVEIEEPEKFGYDFAGWYYGNQEVDLSSFNLDVGKVIVKAKWELKKQQVTFNFNGGKESGNPTATQKVIELKHNEQISFPELTKNGYTFGGWAKLDGTPFNSGVWISDNSISELVAVWNPVTVIYEFDLNGGTLDKTGGSILYGTSTAQFINLAPKKDGYEFKSWYVNGVKLGFKFDYLPINGNNKVILTAGYTPKSYILTLDAGEGSFSAGVSKTVSVEFGVKKVIQVPNAPTGKYFAGYKIENTDELISSSLGSVVWGKTYNAKLVATYSSEKCINFINYDGSVEVVNLSDIEYMDETSIPQPKTMVGYSASWELDFYDIVKLTDSAEINAILTPNSYAVIFKNGNRVVGTGNYVYGEEVNLPNGDEIKKDGYDLLGWSLSSTDTLNYMSGTIVWNITRHVELYAVWTNFEYTITYDTSAILVDFNLLDENENFASSVQSVTYQKPYKLFTLSTKNNLISVTWLYNGNPFAVSGNYNVNGNIVLTPKITYNSVKMDINLDLNGGKGSTVASIKLNSQFKTMTPTPIAPTNKTIVAYSYKDQIYFPNDIFKIVDYDGSPIKVIYEDFIYFKINLDVNGGTGDNTAIIEYGKTLGSMNARPIAPSGKKLVGFTYNGVEYSLSYVWDFASYDGGVFKAIYVDDDLDWSPTV